MGTISDKLTYLNTTKTMLRDSLNKFGSNILTTDTFRSYDTKLNDIYDKLPKVTQSGTGFTLEDVQNGLVDDFKMIGTDLEQNTTTGKNYLNTLRELHENYTTTDNGITFTLNKNGTITANGTVEGNENARFTFLIRAWKINGTDKKLTSQLLNGSFSGRCAFFSYDANYDNAKSSGIPTDGTIDTKDLTSNIEYSRFRLTVYVGATINNATFGLMVVDTNKTDLLYEKYTGGIPSPNPDYPQEIKVVEGRQVISDKGKNLFDKNNANIIVASFSQDYKTISQISNNAKILYISCKENTTYTVSKISSARFRILTTDIVPALEVTGIDFIQNDTSTSLTITTSSNVNYLCVYYFINGTDTLTELEILDSIQIEEGTTATDYEPYYNPVSYNIDLNLENIQLAKIPNTDYKNRIYKSNGNWYYEEKVKKVVLDGSETGTVKNIGTNNWFYQLSVNGNQTDQTKQMCSHYNNVGIYNSNTNQGIMLETAGNYIRIRFGTEDTIENYKSWLSTHNVIVWYPLTTPVTTQITNTTLINQLNAISVHTGTNIITLSSDNNMTPQIEITRLKELERLS